MEAIRCSWLATIRFATSTDKSCVGTFLYGYRSRKRVEERLQQENVALREEIDRASMFEEIVGTSPALQSGTLAHLEGCAN